MVRFLSSRCNWTAITAAVVFIIHTQATAGWWEIDAEFEVAELPDMLPDQWAGLELGDTVYYSTMLYATSPADNYLHGSAATQVLGLEYLTEHDPDNGWFVNGIRSHSDWTDQDLFQVSSVLDGPSESVFSLSLRSWLWFDTSSLPPSPPTFPTELPLDLLVQESSVLGGSEGDTSWLIPLAITSWHATWVPSPFAFPPLVGCWLLMPRQRQRS